MPKVKIPRKSTSVDMTAMTDVAFLLLTFFMLATKFKPDEPVQVDTPSSVSVEKLSEINVMLLSVDKTGRVFYSIDGQPTRQELLRQIGTKYKIDFTPAEQKAFSLVTSFGIPVAQMKEFLAMRAEDRSKLQQPGIPSDSLNNELSDWIQLGRVSNFKVNTVDPNVALKADAETPYTVVKQVIATLQDKKVNSFKLITTMEKPE